ncbi:hypothetical protein KBC79_06625 [Candidatus Woesebacteria bacterium]|nr:hypothetical protein [Candidatus Woesebacteria bacterium]
MSLASFRNLHERSISFAANNKTRAVDSGIKAKRQIENRSPIDQNTMREAAETATDVADVLSTFSFNTATNFAARLVQQNEQLLRLSGYTQAQAEEIVTLARDAVTAPKQSEKNQARVPARSLATTRSRYARESSLGLSLFKMIAILMIVNAILLSACTPESTVQTPITPSSTAIVVEQNSTITPEHQATPTVPLIAAQESPLATATQVAVNTVEAGPTRIPADGSGNLLVENSPAQNLGHALIETKIIDSVFNLEVFNLIDENGQVVYTNSADGQQMPVQIGFRLYEPDTATADPNDKTNDVAPYGGPGALVTFSPNLTLAEIQNLTREAIQDGITSALQDPLTNNGPIIFVGNPDGNKPGELALDPSEYTEVTVVLIDGKPKLMAIMREADGSITLVACREIGLDADGKPVDNGWVRVAEAESDNTATFVESLLDDTTTPNIVLPFFRVGPLDANGRPTLAPPPVLTNVSTNDPTAEEQALLDTYAPTSFPLSEVDRQTLFNSFLSENFGITDYEPTTQAQFSQDIREYLGFNSPTVSMTVPGTESFTTPHYYLAAKFLGTREYVFNPDTKFTLLLFETWMKFDNQYVPVLFEISLEEQIARYTWTTDEVGHGVTGPAITGNLSKIVPVINYITYQNETYQPPQSNYVVLRLAAQVMDNPSSYTTAAFVSGTVPDGDGFDAYQQSDLHDLAAGIEWAASPGIVSLHIQDGVFQAATQQ